MQPMVSGPVCAYVGLFCYHALLFRYLVEPAGEPMSRTLYLLRHGQTRYNAELRVARALQLGADPPGEKPRPSPWGTG